MNWTTYRYPPAASERAPALHPFPYHINKNDYFDSLIFEKAGNGGFGSNFSAELDAAPQPAAQNYAFRQSKSRLKIW
jgi:hypothetical protein